MEEKFGFDNINTDEDNFDLFAEGFADLEKLAGYFPYNDEELDFEAFILAVVAGYGLADEEGWRPDDCLEAREYELINDISPLIHPDRATADYAVYWARRYLKSKASLFSNDNTKSRTVYVDISRALGDIIYSYSGKDNFFGKYFPNTMMLDHFEYELNIFMNEERECKYYDNPFFAFVVCIYISFRCHTTKKEAVSIMHQKIYELSMLDIRGREDCHYFINEISIINDAILLVDYCLNDNMAKLFSPTTIIWHMLLELTRYYDGIRKPKHDICCDDDDEMEATDPFEENDEYDDDEYDDSDLEALFDNDED